MIYQINNRGRVVMRFIDTRSAEKATGIPAEEIQKVLLKVHRTVGGFAFVSKKSKHETPKRKDS